MRRFLDIDCERTVVDTGVVRRDDDFCLVPPGFGKAVSEGLAANAVGSVDYPQIRLNALLRGGEAVERGGVAEAESADIETYPRRLALDGDVRYVGGAAAPCVGRDESVVARLRQRDACRGGVVVPLVRYCGFGVCGQPQSVAAAECGVDGVAGGPVGKEGCSRIVIHFNRYSVAFPGEVERVGDGNIVLARSCYFE